MHKLVSVVPSVLLLVLFAAYVGLDIDLMAYKRENSALQSKVESLQQTVNQQKGLSSVIISDSLDMNEAGKKSRPVVSFVEGDNAVPDSKRRPTLGFVRSMRHQSLAAPHAAQNHKSSMEAKDAISFERELMQSSETTWRQRNQLIM
ncbi:hypothetical protein [Shewanella gelidii]|uniref:Uncharacterized protein n=1 Tax=Shewanella gelidii TaxID=1642821 RepID=A0A917JRC4_9GAMM|nr:hypothetical protein [Shewanella gelidii]MCL1098192.1 hypothetical protein [Shewanella gelidii]GGI83255.1 hypothetical protein GCM10009332_20710 [Shewanella gelidii]